MRAVANDVITTELAQETVKMLSKKCAERFSVTRRFHATRVEAFSTATTPKFSCKAAATDYYVRDGASAALSAATPR